MKSRPLELIVVASLIAAVGGPARSSAATGDAYAEENELAREVDDPTAILT
jgi:hypothetical protein